MKLQPSRRKLCVHHTIMHHFMQSYIRKVYVCLAVTCHLHLSQNDRDLLRAIAVTRGWNEYRNKSQHRKLTLEKKILPLLMQGFELPTFQSWGRRSNHWPTPPPPPPLCTSNSWTIFSHNQLLPFNTPQPEPGLVQYFHLLPFNSCILDPNTETIQKKAYLLGHRQHIFREIPFFAPQNDT